MNARDLPTVLRDTREELPLSPFLWRTVGGIAERVRLPTRDVGLETGDYSLHGVERLVIVERKSIQDLWGTCFGAAPMNSVGEAQRAQDRFRRELHRMRGAKRKWLLVEGSKGSLMAYARERYERNGSRGRSPEENVNSLLDILAAMEVDYGVSLKWEGGREGAEAWLGRVLYRVWDQSAGGPKALVAEERGLTLDDMPWLRTHIPESERDAVRDNDRFMSRIDSSGGPDSCWPWTGATDTRGYGHVKSGYHGFRTHRVAWKIHNGPIPEGANVLHRCDNRPCCNPAHLFLGTIRDNAVDMVAKGRHVSRVHPESIVRGEAHPSSKSLPTLPASATTRAAGYRGSAVAAGEVGAPAHGAPRDVDAWRGRATPPEATAGAGEAVGGAGPGMVAPVLGPRAEACDSADGVPGHVLAPSPPLPVLGGQERASLDGRSRIRVKGYSRTLFRCSPVAAPGADAFHTEGMIQRHWPIVVDSAAPWARPPVPSDERVSQVLAGRAPLLGVAGSYGEHEEATRRKRAGRPTTAARRGRAGA